MGLTILTLLALVAPACAGETQLITAALFGELSRTSTFDANDDAAVSVADLTAQVERGEPASPGCGDSPPPEGRQTIEVDSVTRQFLVRLPADYDNRQPHPVVFGFHGFTGRASGEEVVAQLSTHWPEAIGVYGEGLPRTIEAFGSIVAQGWQLYAGEFEDRDVHFFDAMLAFVTSGYCINPRRIYVTGHSNGAFFSHVLGCLRGDVVAGIGPMAGGALSCPGDTPVAVIISHGTTDGIVPFSLGRSARDLWIARNGCTTERTPYAGRCEINPDCLDDRQVAFCAFTGSHVPDPEFPANMFRFFREHAL